MHIWKVLGCLMLLVGVCGCGDTPNGGLVGGAERGGVDARSAGLQGLEWETWMTAALGCAAWGYRWTFHERGRLTYEDWRQTTRFGDGVPDPRNPGCNVMADETSGTYSEGEEGIVVLKRFGEPDRIWQVHVDNPPQAAWPEGTRTRYSPAPERPWLLRYAFHQIGSLGTRFATRDLDRLYFDDPQPWFDTRIELNFSQPVDAVPLGVLNAQVTIDVSTLDSVLPQSGQVDLDVRCSLVETGVEDWVAVYPTSTSNRPPGSGLNPAQRRANELGEHLMNWRRPLVMFRRSAPNVLISSLWPD